MKRILSLVLALMMLLALTVPAFAVDVPLPDDTGEQGGIMPYAELCMVCRQGSLVYKTITRPRQIKNERCPKGDGLHLDVVCGRILVCNNCDHYAGIDKSQSYYLVSCTSSSPCFDTDYLWKNY